MLTIIVSIMQTGKMCCHAPVAVLLLLQLGLSFLLFDRIQHRNSGFGHAPLHAMLLAHSLSHPPPLTQQACLPDPQADLLQYLQLRSLLAPLVALHICC